uniref:Fibronectin type-III domain-containing protein n=1 Tax=Malurus cyaneus samueli TaxID=2593467 RepID=A0A8C5X5Y3_9PASS
MITGWITLIQVHHTQDCTSSSSSLPKAPGTPMVTETTATSITITWDSGNPDPVSYYVIEYKSKSQDGPYQIKEDITTTRYSIGGLSPNSEYEIWVSAVNSIGQGPPSESVVTRTGEQAPASAPRNVQGRMLSSTSPGWDGAPQFQSQDLPTLHFAADVLFPHRLGKKTGKEPPS